MLYTLLTQVCFSTLIGCGGTFVQQIIFQCIQTHFCLHPPYHTQVVLTWVTTFRGRHNPPQKIGMHHQHVVAGLWSCSIPIAQREREVGEGERGQEDQAEVHLCGRSVSVLLYACVVEVPWLYYSIYHTICHPMNPTSLWVACVLA